MQTILGLIYITLFYGIPPVMEGYSLLLTPSPPSLAFCQDLSYILIEFSMQFTTFLPILILGVFNSLKDGTSDM